ncbi:hypothetical protein ACFQS6_05085 [Xanthomonas populi]|nr:hypothetical protein [Xanthomonas populi]
MKRVVADAAAHDALDVDQHFDACTEGFSDKAHASSNAAQRKTQ